MDDSSYDLFVLQNVQRLCKCLSLSPDDAVDMDLVLTFKDVVGSLPVPMVQKCQSMLIATVYKLLTKKLNENKRILIIDTFSGTLNKLQFMINDSTIFFNLYGMLLQEICDPQAATGVKNVCEEYKLSVVKCMINLMKTFSWDIVPKIYNKQNVPKFSTMIHICVKLALHEKLRELRIKAINCLIAIALLEKNDPPDYHQYDIISDVFIYFLPGIAGTLVKICTEDEKVGQYVITTSLEAFATLVCLCMRKYGETDEEDPGDIFKAPSEKSDVEAPCKKFENADDISNYLNSVTKDSNWYAEHDVKLELCMNLLAKLGTSENPLIRGVLAEQCYKISCNCLSTLPKTCSKAIEILITYSQYEESPCIITYQDYVSELSEKINGDSLKMKTIRDILEQNFYSAITKLPRIFNGLDEKEVLMTLSLIVGYLSVFNEHRMKVILFTPANLNRILQSLIHIATLRTDVSLLEEYCTEDLEQQYDNKTPWRVFTFYNKNIEKKLKTACKWLGRPDVSDIVLDYLLDLFVNDVERKEVTLITNEVLSVPHNSDDSIARVKPFISIYLDEEYWNLPLTPVDKKCTLGEAQNNVVQICLQIEGIGKMAVALKTKFRNFLLKVLYQILEKAGLGNPIIRTAGLQALSDISEACKYGNVTELINDNSDYFSYHVVRKLKRVHDDGVLNVLAVVMKFSDMDVLPSLSEVMDGVLVESCDKYELKNTNTYLRVFKVFIQCLYKWLDVKVKVPLLKMKKDREKEAEELKMIHLKQLDTDFSDEAIMGKTAEELWKEDMAKSKVELGEIDIEENQYKKPDPPLHIKLTVSILKRSLNFLPSRDQSRKILVLEILKTGIEILHDWEDELLPMVHLIWSPLVNRFKEYDTPLIINLSFQLLDALARLSTDFIRSRTIKDAMPSILEALKRQSRLSYLTDEGSPYRYTQGYKMQQAVLSRLGYVCYNLHIADSGTKLFLEAIEPYLSNKQPLSLQNTVNVFFNILYMMDPVLWKKCVTDLEIRYKDNEDYNNKCTSLHNTDRPL